jgi:hypothetical protein
MAQYLANLSRIRDDRDELHLGSTLRADQGIDLVYLCDQPCPCRTAGALGHGPCLRGCSVRGELLGMRVFPASRGDPGDVGQTHPARPASGGVKPVVVNVAHTPAPRGTAEGRDELSEGGDEVCGVPQACVLLEVGIVGGVVEDLAPVGS